jgi:hypothetical protein
MTRAPNIVAFRIDFPNAAISVKHSCTQISAKASQQRHKVYQISIVRTSRTVVLAYLAGMLDTVRATVRH